MKFFEDKITQTNQDLMRLIEKYIADEEDWVRATEARKAIFSCAKIMNGVLQEVSRSGGDINRIMDDKAFYATPEETLASFKKLEEAFHATYPVVRAQAMIKRDVFQTIINEITDKLDDIERVQLKDASAQ
ncbi:MAG: hypothetical protein P1U61_08845 [Legionellaceae bacterium]|nr:hypothetical protein [Legionellaceae bacterium]